MRLMLNAFRAALAVSCLSIAACGGSGSADPLSSLNSKVAAASVPGAAGTDTASVNGTTIPAAAQIVDGSGNVWAVSGGVISENGALAGYSADVTLLLYDNNTIYQQNSAGGWWSWVGGTWASSTDPRLVSSPSGATIPNAAQITDPSGNVWAVAGGVIYENGAAAGYSADVTLLLYESGGRLVVLECRHLGGQQRSAHPVALSQRHHHPIGHADHRQQRVCLDPRRRRRCGEWRRRGLFGQCDAAAVRERRHLSAKLRRRLVVVEWQRMGIEQRPQKRPGAHHWRQSRHLGCCRTGL
jgi:hypothetical protein